jgi:hypothetical protein
MGQIDAALAGTNLCAADEETVFLCETAKGIVSICGSNSTEHPSLQYRYGSKSALELIFQDQAAEYASVFAADNLTYAGGGGAYLQCTNNKYEYTVFSATGQWGKHHKLAEAAGVVIKTEGKTAVTLRCKVAPSSKLGPKLFKEYALKSATSTKEFESTETFFESE